MQRLTAGELCWTPAVTELAALEQALRVAPLPAAVQLTIHDPFLWRAIHPDAPFPDGGCQAANTMLYLSPEGTVYPCPLVPLPLGNIQESSLLEIARGEDKRLVRAQIRQLPIMCGDCPELAACHAGCRGRAYVVNGWQAQDPACDR
jgi:GeoRSP system SPASM domain protein